MNKKELLDEIADIYELLVNIRGALDGALEDIKRAESKLEAIPESPDEIEDEEKEEG